MFGLLRRTFFQPGLFPRGTLNVPFVESERSLFIRPEMTLLIDLEPALFSRRHVRPAFSLFLYPTPFLLRELFFFPFSCECSSEFWPLRCPENLFRWFRLRAAIGDSRIFRVPVRFRRVNPVSYPLTIVIRAGTAFFQRSFEVTYHNWFFSRRYCYVKCKKQLCALAHAGRKLPILDSFGFSI